jgi:hypothetical protein
MSDLPPTFAQRLLRSGVPLTLLLDLHDPEGMRVALAAELLESDVRYWEAWRAPSRRPDVGRARLTS